MKTFTLILSLAIIGFSAAFFRPAQPHQAPAAIEIRGGGLIFRTDANIVDEGLDNPNVQADESITAARKCGFCMGVSLSILLHCTHLGIHYCCASYNPFVEPAIIDGMSDT